MFGIEYNPIFKIKLKPLEKYSILQLQICISRSIAIYFSLTFYL